MPNKRTDVTLVYPAGSDPPQLHTEWFRLTDRTTDKPTNSNYVQFKACWQGLVYTEVGKLEVTTKVRNGLQYILQPLPEYHRKF